MGRFFLNIFLFSIVFLLTLGLVYLLGNTLIDKSDYYKLASDKKYVIFGNSHSESAYNDSIIENFQNLSNSGESYFYTYLKVKKIISSNTHIKAVFIEYTNFMIDKSMDSWAFNDTYLPIRMPTYLPLMDFEDIEVLWQHNKQGFINCFPKSFMRNIGRNYSHSFFQEKGFIKDARFGGYLYLKRSKTDSLVNVLDNKHSPLKNNQFVQSDINVAYLAKTIDYCKSHNVKVYLIRTPLHTKCNGLQNEAHFQELVQSKFYNSEFIDFKDFPLQNSEFGDLDHLNYKGARVYSKFFNSYLKSKF